MAIRFDGQTVVVTGAGRGWVPPMPDSLLHTRAAGRSGGAGWWDRGEALDLGPTVSAEDIAARWQHFVAPAPGPE